MPQSGSAYDGAAGVVTPDVDGVDSSRECTESTGGADSAEAGDRSNIGILSISGATPLGRLFFSFEGRRELEGDGLVDSAEGLGRSGTRSETGGERACSSESLLGGLGAHRELSSCI